MKIRKTKRTDRGVYRYPINVPDSNGEYRVEYIAIHPGEDGVTELDIKLLHSMDDSEVYYNCKNGHPMLTQEEKAMKQKWKNDHPGEKYPSGWNLSLDYFADSEDDASDKHQFLEDTACGVESEESPEIEHLHEIVSAMTKRQQEVYKLLYIDEYSLTEAAQILGMSIPTVHNHKKRITEIIKKNF